MSVDFATRQQILRDIASGVVTRDSSVKYGYDELEFRRRSETEFAKFRKKNPRATITFSSGPEGLPEPKSTRLDGGPGSGPHAGYKRTSKSTPSKSASVATETWPTEIGEFSGSSVAPAVKKSTAPSSYAKVSTKKLTSKLVEYREKVKTAAPGSKAAKLAEIKLKHIESELESRGVDHSGVKATVPALKSSITAAPVVVAKPPVVATPEQIAHKQAKEAASTATKAAVSGTGTWADANKAIANMTSAAQAVSVSKYTPQEKATHHGKQASIQQNTAIAVLTAKKVAGLSDSASTTEFDYQLKAGQMKMAKAEQLHAEGKFEDASAYMKLAKGNFELAQVEVHKLKTKKQDLEAEIIKNATGEIKLAPKTMSDDSFVANRKTFTKSLTSTERSALEEYSGFSYQAINQSARHGEASHGAIKDMDTGIAKAVRDTPLVTYRGSKSKNFGDLQVGDSFVDKGYASTSVALSTANGFSSDIIMHITTPAGKAIAPIPSEHAHEKEYLLPRNTKFKVTKIEIGMVLGDPKKVIHVEVE